MLIMKTVVLRESVSWWLQQKRYRLTIGWQWCSCARELCGPDWGSELRPCSVCRKGCIFKSLKRILAFVLWLYSTEGPWGHRAMGASAGLGTFNWPVHIHAFPWRGCLIYAQKKILSYLPLMNWFRAREWRVQAKVCCLEYSISFCPPILSRIPAVTITTEHRTQLIKRLLF